MNIDSYFQHLHIPAPDSHKGQNGKLLLIGGSDLFHAASKWSLDVASQFVDMLFYSSVPSNNDLVLQAKGEFWNGIVVRREDIESYIEEADCVLIGPGMTRTDETATITNSFVKKYVHKKWVIDAGALQMMDPSLLRPNMIITPHHKELEMVLSNLGESLTAEDRENDLTTLSKKLGGAIVVLKGTTDKVFNDHQQEEISGGNGGMTKGGTGDVLAGLIAGLYCTNEAFPSAVMGSYINKAAGDDLYEKVGPFFNASNLVQQIPLTLWEKYNQVKK
jgi:hydroxyethylthiazole kinase-like uncharacterized protein yjeF